MASPFVFAKFAAANCPEGGGASSWTCYSPAGTDFLQLIMGDDKLPTPSPGGIR